jgi:hypothetical protein
MCNHYDDDATCSKCEGMIYFQMRILLRHSLLVKRECDPQSQQYGRRGGSSSSEKDVSHTSVQ